MKIIQQIIIFTENIILHYFIINTTHTTTNLEINNKCTYERKNEENMKLKLITTETFNTVPCDFYRDMNDDMLLTREQIGQALEYKDPSKAIRKIHLKHKDRLEPLCIRLKLDNNQNGANLSKSEEQERVYYTQRGIMELCRWSRQPKADKFMDWAWDIIESYRNNTLSSQNIDMKAFTDILVSLSNTQAAMAHTLNLLNEKINNIEEQPRPKRKYSYWTSKMFPKYEELMNYLGYESNGELYKYLYKEFNDMYPDYDLRQVADDYCYENKLETCFTLDAIEHDKTIRKLFEKMVDNLLEECRKGYEERKCDVISNHG